MRLTHKISKQSFVSGIFILLPAYLFAGILIFSALFAFLSQNVFSNLDNESMNAVYNFLFDLSFVILAIFFFRKEIAIQIKDLKRKSKTEFINNVLLGIPVMYLASISGNVLSMILTGELSQSANQELIETLIKQLPVLMIITVTILAPILEELIFRLLLFTGFYKWGRGAAYVASAGLFGLLHVFQQLIRGNFAEILMVFPYLFMGAALCFIYEKSDNIFAPMLCHGIMNTISVIILML